MTVHHFKTGKKPARPGAIEFKLSDFLVPSKLPTRPAVFGHEAAVKVPWGMLGNDTVGDCVLAGGGHETMLTNAEAGVTVTITKANTLSDYSAITGYNPKDPNSDQGTDMATAAAYRRKTGLIDSKKKRHRVDAYFDVHKGNLDQILNATFLFGAAGIGIEFPDFAMDQFNAGKPWDVEPNAPAPTDGHYIPCVGFDGTYLLVVTWGKIQKMTPAFFTKYCDEAVAYVYLEALKNGVSPEGYNITQLEADLAQLKAA